MTLYLGEDDQRYRKKNAISVIFGLFTAIERMPRKSRSGVCDDCKLGSKKGCQNPSNNDSAPILFQQRKKQAQILLEQREFSAKFQVIMANFQSTCQRRNEKGIQSML